MRQVKHFFLVSFTQCCCSSEEPHPEDTRHDSSVFFTNASLVKLAPTDGVKEAIEDKGESGNPRPMLRLSLEVVESPHLPVGQCFAVTPAGLRDAQKAMEANKTIIGADAKLCDIVLVPDEERIEAKQCEISFEPESNAYIVKDLGEETSGTYYKIEERFVLHTDDLLAFGLSIASVQIQERGTASTMTMRFWAGPKTGESPAFGSNDEVIKIGRVADCSLIIDDANLSRHQCYIRFEPGRGWIITDGDVTKKPSANGTWLCVKSMPLTHGMTIRVGATSFKVWITQVHLVEDYEES